ncbi:MAG: CHAD domain-containing protein [Erythrobacter sp.]
MVYSFKHADEIQEQFRSIGEYQIGQGLLALDDSGMERAEIVHDVRKRCKKLRGLIRLVRPSFARYKAENKAFRSVAHLFDDFRDAKVLQDTYDMLLKRFDEQVDRSAFASIRGELTRRHNALSTDDEWDARRGRAKGALLEARERARKWTLDDSGWDAIDDGLAKTYGRALKAMREAREKPEGENLHEWRKRVKYHWYHTRLLKNAAPDLLKPRAELLSELADLLGDHHDLHVFAERIAREPDEYGDEESVALLKAMGASERSALEERAFLTGERLFADPPDVLAGRCRAFWRSWRKAEAAGHAA